ncbi:hypothetical protein ZHAS_00003507 [Anopheles sinensis]|uniref:Uncharacterized protein n=1 Tax=Anopheles sinensis TaxID=74873 RepID=A0A084VEG0_ANOSI|nr:hypothetical protein ZHAS_00003507 [Anopheles sinensis]
MCKVAATGKNSLLLDNNKRVRSFFRKPRYTHFCSVWYIIDGRSGTRRTPHDARRPEAAAAAPASLQHRAARMQHRHRATVRFNGGV